MTNQWLSIVDYARHHNISDMTVRRRIKTGKLQAVLKDGKYYVQLGEATAAPVPASVPAAASVAAPPVPARSSNPVQAPAPLAPPVQTHAPMPVLTHKQIAVPPVEAPKAAVVDNASLIEFCNAALVKLNQAEEQIKANYQSTIAALDEKIRHLEAQLELSKLREARFQQEVQDLQLLLQMMEQPQQGAASQPI